MCSSIGKMVKQKHWLVGYDEEPLLVVPTTQLRELHVKTLRENCIMEKTFSFLDWKSLRAGAYSLPLQAVLPQNLPSKPITGYSQSDIHKKFSILSFKWSFPPCYSWLAFPLVSRWMRSHCRRWGSLILLHWDQGEARVEHKTCEYNVHVCYSMETVLIYNDFIDL